VILVTGATGNVGGALLGQLCSSGVPVRALVRSSERGDILRGYDCEIAVGAYEDPASLHTALHDVERVFLVAPAGEGMADLEIAALQAIRAGRPDARVVLLAAEGVDAPGERGGRVLAEHRRVVRHLRDSGLPGTVLAPGSFMQNLLRQAGSVQEHDVLALPAGTAAVNHVDVRDVAAVAAHVLTSDGHDGATYTVTGPEALTYEQVAASLAEVLGREVRYVDAPPQDARAALVGGGLSPWLADALLELHEAYRSGHGATVTDEVEKATGRPARPLRQFLTEHAAAFR
jgi:uncharacterized protein YbjT (DUF2867 family)